MDEYVENKCKNCIHCNVCCIKENFKDLVRAIHAKNHSNHFNISIECNERINLYFDKADNNQDDDNVI